MNRFYGCRVTGTDISFSTVVMNTHNINQTLMVTLFPKHKILDWFKLKAFADNKKKMKL